MWRELSYSSAPWSKCRFWLLPAFAFVWWPLFSNHYHHFIKTELLITLPFSTSYYHKPVILKVQTWITSWGCFRGFQKWGQNNFYNNTTLLLPFPLRWHLYWWCQSSDREWNLWHMSTNQGSVTKPVATVFIMMHTQKITQTNQLHLRMSLMKQ